MSDGPEFSRVITIDTLGEAPRLIAIEADATERAALAARFGLVAIESLSADAHVRREADTLYVAGRFRARATQSCVATGEPVPERIDEPFALRLEPEGSAAAEEVELDQGDLDVISYEGTAIDLGELVAQGFALALDPFPRVADADTVLRAAGVLSEDEAEAARQAANPFAALKGLKD